MVNTTDTVQKIRKINFKTEDIREYNVYSVAKPEMDIKRKEKLRELLGKSVDIEYKNELLTLCEQYSDIFALD